jgi:ELP3 family radical SAM enzyme/protein acetyltransferase
MSCHSNIEDCYQSIDHLNIHTKIKNILRDINIETLAKYVTDLANHTYNNLDDYHKFTKICSKRYSIKPRNVQTNYMYRKLRQEGKIPKNINLQYCLISKLGRKSSGIQQISVLTTPDLFNCKHDCAYCPNFKTMPRSYIPNEPACRRATQNNFKPELQFWDRATSYSLSGHPNDKIEVIILGGTWDDYPWEYRKEFVRDLFWAANTLYQVDKRDRLSLKEEQHINETASCKIIGLTIESRPDYVKIPENILSYLELGVTRVQYGVQSIYDDVLKLIKRGCKHQDTIDATKMIHDSGYKHIIHIMPNLPYPDGEGSMYTSIEKDEEMFDYLMNSDECQADEWKVYPTQIPKTDIGEEVFHNTKIEKWFQDGEYQPYHDQDLIELAVRVKKKLSDKEHNHLRITRFIRDIPMGNIQGGASIPNMRQHVHKRLEEEGITCPCIRCSEIKDRDITNHKVETKIQHYKASGGDEYFISKEVNIEGKRYIIGFIRLRLSKNAGSNFLPVLYNSALIRELHVYGNLSSTINQTDFNQSNTQHMGYGRSLLKEAENIAIKHGYRKMSIISGVGVRNYYRKMGYELDSGYMTKSLFAITDYIPYLIIVFLNLFIIIKKLFI